MALIAKSWQQAELLEGGAIVATVMSNLGLERFLKSLGLRLDRTQVGDRYVVEHMRRLGLNVGGEQSGHMILTDYATTGDGLIAALQVLGVLVHSGQPASKVCRLFTPLPQLLRSVRVNGGQPLEAAAVIAAIRAGEQRLGDKGRLLIRKSGTEPVIRVMAESEDKGVVDTVVDEVAAAIERAAS